MHRRYRPASSRLQREDLIQQTIKEDRSSALPHDESAVTAFFRSIVGWPYRHRQNKLSGAATEYSEEQFLLDLADGNQNAWQTVLEIWSPHLYPFLLYSTHCAADAEDLLEQTFCAVVQTVMQQTFCPQSASELKVLIASTLYRRVTAYHEQSGTPTLCVSLPSEPLSALQKKFLNALEQLALPVRQLLLMRYLIGVSVHELAAITGYSAANIRLIIRMAALHFSQIDDDS